MLYIGHRIGFYGAMTIIFIIAAGCDSTRYIKWLGLYDCHFLDPHLESSLALSVRNLYCELSSVNWHQLGVAFGMASELDNIQSSHPTEGVERWRSDLFCRWLKNTPNASWNDVVKALREIKEGALAERIAAKYIGRTTGITLVLRIH